MSFRFLFGLIFAVCLGAAAQAQNTAAPVITGYLSTSGCPSAALTPCFIQYGAGGGGGGGSTTATASATPTPVLAGTGKPLNIDLFSELFVQPAFGGQVVDLTHGLPTNCVSGCSGGPADESTFTPGTTPTVTGGFFQTTATNNALTNLQSGAVQMTASRAFFTNLRTAAGVETGIAAAPLQVSLANTAANATPVSINGTGTAGTANSGVVTVQGIASMTKLLVTPDSVALPANQSVNVAQINAVTPLMGNGVTGTGSQRVTIASDNTPFQIIGQDTQTTTTPTVTASAYSAGNCVGGFNAVTISRANGSNGLIQNVILMSKTGLTPTLTVFLFNANPSSSTCTDKSTFTLNVADLPKLIAAPFALTLSAPNGATPSMAELANMARPFIAGGSSGSGVQTIYFGMTVTAAVTPASTSEFIVNIGADLN